MKNILLIGNCGYVGSAIQNKLKKKYYITGLDTCWFSNPIENTINNDYAKMNKDFFAQFDVIILMAGHSSVKMCEGDFTNSYKNNVENFINLVNKINKGTKFLYASSSSVYGKCTDVAYETYDNFIPYNNYDITKHMIDTCIDRYDVEYYGLRFGTVNGYAPIVRKDVMINAMYTSAIHNNEIKLYIKDIMRPILGIDDLTHAVEAIIDSEDDHRGIYNLASFNKTAEEIAYTVGDLIKIPVVEYDTNPTIITNTKLQTVCYDFKINTSKFENTFDFKFNETIETIVGRLKNNNFIETVRDKQFKYDGI